MASSTICLTNDKIQHEYVKNYTDYTFIVREDFAFENGIYSGYDADNHKLRQGTPGITRCGADGFVKTDPTLAHPRCVYQSDEATLCALYTGDGGARLRNAKGEVPAHRPR